MRVDRGVPRRAHGARVRRRAGAGHVAHGDLGSGGETLDRSARCVDRWIESLPIVAEVPPVSGKPTMVLPPATPGASERRIFDVEVAGLLVRRSCEIESCVAILSAADVDRDPTFAEGAAVSSDASMFIRRDDRHDLWIVDGAAIPRRTAFRGGTFRVTG